MKNVEIKERNLENVLGTAYDLYLQYGIEKVTKEMISRECGLSRRTLDRYFADKTDCVLQTMEYFLLGGQEKLACSDLQEKLDGGCDTGAELLELYMNDLREVFMEDPRHFALYNEFKLYVYRNCRDCEEGYRILWNWMGNRHLQRKQAQTDAGDGVLPMDLEAEEAYYCESFFGFLSNLAIAFERFEPAEVERQIAHRIENTLQMYQKGVQFSREAMESIEPM